jgi:DNA-binding transcriptional LysR family regulator
MILNLERVVRFVAVADQLSFTRAAQLLRIDQPWLSRQIMQLEEQLGVTLFDRNGSRIALTAEGQEFYTYAKEVADATERARLKAEEMNRRALSMLRIGVSNSTHSIEGRKRLLSAYSALRPKVSLEFSAFAFSDEVIDQVIAGALDFGIVFGPADDPNLEMCVLDIADPSVAIPEEDPLAKQPGVALADLKGRRIAVALRSRSCPRYARAYSWIDDVGATPVFVPEGRRYVFDVALEERLVTLCYTPADRIPDGFVRRPLAGPHPTYDICLVRGRRTISTAGEHLWRLGRELAAAHYDQAKPGASTKTRKPGAEPAPVDAFARDPEQSPIG